MTVDIIKIYRVAGVACFVFVLVAGSLFFLSSRSDKRAAPSEQSVQVHAIDVSHLALAAAALWSPDVVLAYINSGAVEQIGGRSATWEFIFVAPSKKGKGYRITIADRAITHQEEIDYQGGGAPLPEAMLPQDVAVKRVRAMPGFEHVDIFGVEAVYGTSGKVWYWGVKTSKGVISVEAK